MFSKFLAISLAVIGMRAQPTEEIPDIEDVCQYFRQNSPQEGTTWQVGSWQGVSWTVDDPYGWPDGQVNVTLSGQEVASNVPIGWGYASGPIIAPVYPVLAGEQEFNFCLYLYETDPATPAQCCNGTVVNIVE